MRMPLVESCNTPRGLIAGETLEELAWNARELQLGGRMLRCGRAMLWAQPREPLSGHPRHSHRSFHSSIAEPRGVSEQGRAQASAGCPKFGCAGWAGVAQAFKYIACLRDDLKLCTAAPGAAERLGMRWWDTKTRLLVAHAVHDFAHVLFAQD